MTVRLLGVIVLLLAVAARADAQAVESYRLNFYNAGAAQPLQVTDTFPVAAVTCNQAPPAAGGTTVNPNRALWDDPVNAGRVCIWTASAGSSLLAMPTPGNYEATLVAINAAGASAESNRAPFSRLSPPGVRTGLAVIR